ncbi:MAG: hypothetical protein ABL973_13555 [Micropepsaceae bacterium]
MRASRIIFIAATALAAGVFNSITVSGEPIAATACPTAATVPASPAAPQVVVATQVPNPAVPDTAPSGRAGVDSSFQVRYATNLSIGDSVVNFQNPQGSDPAPAKPAATNLTTAQAADCTPAVANTIPAATATPPAGSMAPIPDEPTAPIPPANLKCKAGKVPARLTRRSGKTVWRCVNSTTEATSVRH